MLMMAAAATCSATTVTYLNYATGDTIQGDSADSAFAPTLSVNSDSEGMTIRWAIPYAILTDSPTEEGCVRWMIPGMSLNMLQSTPEVPTYTELYDLPSGMKSVTFEVTDAEYVDFSGYRLAAPPSAVSDNSTGEIPYYPITAYEGWYPTQTYSYNDRNFAYRGQYKVQVTTNPVQYDYEHQTVRAYTSLTFRLTYHEYKSEIQEVTANSPAAEYFTIDGRKISAVRPSGLLIERRADGTSAKIFLK